MKKRIADIVLNDWKIKLICLLSSVLLWTFVQFLKRSTIKINVPLHLESLSDKLILTSSAPRYVKLYVRGEKENLRFPTTNIRAVINLSHTKEGSFEYVPDFDIKQLPPRVEFISISQVKLSFERAAQKKLLVSVVLTGKPKPGYQVGQVLSSPNRVLMKGPRSQLKNIYKIYTPNVNIDNRDSDLKKTISLIKPGPVLSYIDQNDKINLFVRIFKSNTEDKKMLNGIPVQILNLGSDYDAFLERQSISIYLQGNKDILQEVKSEDLKVFIDLDKVMSHESDEAEHYQSTNILIPIEAKLIRFQDKVSIVKAEPSEINVTFQKKSKPGTSAEKNEPSSQ